MKILLKHEQFGHFSSNFDKNNDKMELYNYCTVFADNGARSKKQFKMETLTNLRPTCLG